MASPKPSATTFAPLLDEARLSRSPSTIIMGTPSASSNPPVHGARHRESQFSVHEALQPSIEAATPFTTTSDFFEAVDAVPRGEDAYRASRVTPSQLKAVLRERERRDRKIRFWYVDDARLLLVTIPSMHHECTSRYFFSEVSRQLMGMSLVDKLIPCGATTHSGRGAGGISGMGEGDESWVPLSTRPGSGAWPSLVIEVGVTQTLPEMRAKAQLWFRLSNFEVKIVLLVKLSSAQRSMTVEKWKALPEDPRPGPQTRAATARLEPRCVQTAAVFAPKGARVANPQAFAVVGSDIILEFIQLFLRQPGPNESDIVISTDSLRQIASDVLSL